MILCVVSEKNNAEGSVFFSKVCNICNISVYFPFRRIIDNTVLLEEISLDFALFNNKLEVHIPGEIVLPIVKIVEDENELCFFFATLFTVHEFKLKHPNHNNEFGFILPSEMNVSLPSVFYQAETKHLHKQQAFT